ncbi:AAA family ATPase [Tenggerimyces flavus]|uniref:AAA family ATPase n=1 Tax=Tenggerimyces flavus TaxID=1708749 RepID=A0ABV7YKU1_9ACTN|nr:AAA family ATPase [Tenggerimyces flavus]MBM7789904.1 putative kinase [Tenggerimyces flavus]
MKIGSPRTRLVVLRGPSASGKSSVAHALRMACERSMAWVGQDVLRRTILRERDVPGGINIELIEHTARFALDRGYHVVVEGILDAARYAEMLDRLAAANRGPSFFYYFDVPFDETVRRHATKPEAAVYGPDVMAEWYRDRDLLPGDREQVIDQHSELDATVKRILADTGLPLEPGPEPMPA